VLAIGVSKAITGMAPAKSPKNSQFPAGASFSMFSIAKFRAFSVTGIRFSEGKSASADGGRGRAAVGPASSAPSAERRYAE